MPRIARKDIETQFLNIMVQGINKEYMDNEILYFEEKYNEKIEYIFSDKDAIKELIKYLEKECKFRYIDIMKRLDIPKKIQELK